MVPDPNQMDTCINCEIGKFYDITKDDCRVAYDGEMPFLNCDYDDICLDCK